MTDDDVKKHVITAMRQAMAQWIGAEVPPDLSFMRAQISKVLGALKPAPWLVDILDRSMQLTFGIGSAKELEKKLKELQDTHINYLWDSFGDGVPLLKFEWARRNDLIRDWTVDEEKSSEGGGTDVMINMVPKAPLNYIKIEFDLGGKDEDGDVPDTPAGG
jgi:hypothetical protein